MFITNNINTEIEVNNAPMNMIGQVSNEITEENNQNSFASMLGDVIESVANTITTSKSNNEEANIDIAPELFLSENDIDSTDCLLCNTINNNNIVSDTITSIMPFSKEANTEDIDNIMNIMLSNINNIEFQNNDNSNNNVAVNNQQLSDIVVKNGNNIPVDSTEIKNNLNVQGNLINNPINSIPEEEIIANDIKINTKGVDLNIEMGGTEQILNNIENKLESTLNKNIELVEIQSQQIKENETQKDNVKLDTSLFGKSDNTIILNKYEEQLPISKNEIDIPILEKKNIENKKIDMIASNTTNSIVNEMAGVYNSENNKQNNKDTSSIESNKNVNKEEHTIIQSNKNSGKSGEFNQQNAQYSTTNNDANNYENNISKNIEVKNISEFNKQFVQQVNNIKLEKPVYRTVSNVKLDDFPKITSRMARAIMPDGSQNIKLTFTPKGLGTLFVNLEVSDNNLKLNITSTNVDTLKKIENKIGLLKENIGQQGLKIENIEISKSENDTDLNNQGQSSNKNGQYQEEKKKYLSSFENTNVGGMAITPDLQEEAPSAVSSNLIERYI